MPRRFCARCGSPITPENPYVKGFFCKQCETTEMEEADAEKAQFIYYICPHCFRVSERGTKKSHWFEPEAMGFEALTHEMVERFFLKREKLQDDYEMVPVEPANVPTFSLTATGPTGPRHFELEILQKRKACDVCSKKAGGSFSSTLQIRVTDPRFQPVLNRLAQEVRDYMERKSLKNPEEYIAKEHKATNGVDFDMSTKSLAYRVGSKLRRSAPVVLTQSSKLMGIEREKGGEIYRYTVSLKLLPIMVGDILDIDDTPYLVASFTQDKIALDNLVRDESLHQSYDWFLRTTLRFFYRVGDPLEVFIFVSQQDEVAQFMSKQSFKLYDVPAIDFPEGQEEGSEVAGIMINEQLYLVRDLDVG